LSCCKDTIRVVEKVVVQFVQLSFVNALDRTSIQCFQISFQGSLLHSFRLLQLLGMIKSNSSFWSFKFFSSRWTTASGDLASDELASDDVITSRAFCTSGALFFRSFKLPFCWYFCSLLFFQNLINISNFVYGPVHLNKY